MMRSILCTVIILFVLLTTSCRAAPRIPSTAQINIETIGFTEEWRPSAVTITAGGIVTWTNTGKFAAMHSLISGEGLFNEILAPGDSFSYTFTHNGTFTYHDDPYSSVGTVYVQ